MIQCRPQDSDNGELLDIRETQRIEYTLLNVASDEWEIANEKNCPVLGGVATFSFGEAIKYMKRGLRVKRKGWNESVHSTCYRNLIQGCIWGGCELCT